MSQCSDRKCRAPAQSCRRGEPTPAECQAWHEANKSARAAAITDGTDLTLLPWSGSALGTTDLGFLTGRSDPAVIALLGPHNAGKTTLLGSWYQLLGRSGDVGGRHFAGSYSLEGWEAVAHALRWDGKAPSFPAHTPSGSGRAPGLLHLALRDANQVLSDYLFADAPGEWFQRWAIERNATDADGARWLIERASLLMIIVDCESLAGDNRGSARNNFIQLVRRVADERRGQPVALVWAKSDTAISPAIRDSVRDAALRGMPDLAEFSVSVIDRAVEGSTVNAARCLMELLEWTFEQRARGVKNFETILPADEPFFALGAAG